MISTMVIHNHNSVPTTAANTSGFSAVKKPAMRMATPNIMITKTHMPQCHVSVKVDKNMCLAFTK